MSGGPPHHPHGRQVPAANTAWNHLQVPNFFPRQPQHAHMSNEHSILHPHQTSTWHTPTTETSIKPISHSFPVCFPRNAPGVDLSLTRNGSQNGELPTTPISLSVRDTNKINSLPASALEIQAVELTKCSKQLSPGEKPKRSNIRVDSILERLNPGSGGEKGSTIERIASFIEKTATTTTVAPQAQSVIVQAAGSSHDENSNSSSILNVPTPTNVREEDTISTNSNEDSLDSTKSRRKRKPSKTVRVSNQDGDESVEVAAKEQPKEDSVALVSKMLGENKVVERRRSSDDIETLMPAKTRRKTSSESETIDNIAAMVQECVKDKKSVESVEAKEKESVIQIVTPAQKKATPTQFVDVENKLEEMFAGIEDKTDIEPVQETTEVKDEDPLLKLEESAPVAPMEVGKAEEVAEIITVLVENGEPDKKTKRKKTLSRRNSEISSTETTPKKKKTTKKLKKEVKPSKVTPKGKAKKMNGKQLESMKEVYAYDSGSNASSSKSRGPFIQIKGPRDSPISVSVVNTPQNDEDADKKPNKPKKYHDDSEYRHKVRNRGLHCSTLSNKYDAQTKDATWICAFCKRGPHATELSGPSYTGEITAAGDLFGPYLISADCSAFESRLDDPYDRQFKSKKISKVLDEGNTAKPSKKGRRKQSEVNDDQSDLYLGITDTGNKTYEIWAHEDCIVWSPGIYLVGAKIVGLEEAIWTSCNIKCKICNLKGANICCIKRGCLNMAHVCCSRTANWHFDTGNFKVYCPLHKIQ